MLLDVVKGPERLPADEGSQEMLRGKLRILQSDSTEVEALLTVKLMTHSHSYTQRHIASLLPWWPRFQVQDPKDHENHLYFVSSVVTMVQMILPMNLDFCRIPSNSKYV